MINAKELALQLDRFLQSPTAQQNNECKNCRACWDKSVKNIAYGKH